MLSKIIQKEKDRQDNMLKDYDHELNEAFQVCARACHKQSLINFKEYLTEIVKQTANAIIEYDIKELRNIIGRYK